MTGDFQPLRTSSLNVEKISQLHWNMLFFNLVGFNHFHHHWGAWPLRGVGGNSIWSHRRFTFHCSEDRTCQVWLQLCKPVVFVMFPETQQLSVFVQAWVIRLDPKLLESSVRNPKASDWRIQINKSRYQTKQHKKVNQFHSKSEMLKYVCMIFVGKNWFHCA